MASTISSIDAQIAKLAPTFQTAIKAVVDAESNPLKQTQTQKDSIDVRRSVYTDIKGNFDGLQSALQALISTQDSFGLTLTSKASVTSGTTGSTVLSASTTSDSATIANYDIFVSKLAKAQSKSTDLAYSPDLALGKSGTFWLGGSGTAALQSKTTQGVSLVASNTVTAGAVTATLASGQSELSTGSYILEARNSGGTAQFRLVQSTTEGDLAVSIRNGSSFNSEWQTMTNGSFDTGRGLTLTLNTADLSILNATTSTALSYTANNSDFISNTSVTEAQTATVASGQRELGTGAYALETRDISGVRQFRLLNADGNAASILTQNGTSYTSAWQTMTDGSYDTGRGLSMTLNMSGTTTSTALTYTAAGTSIAISATDSLRTITSLINSASQPEGRDFKASIVANKLVLNGSQTGANHTMLYTDGANLGFGTELQAAQNAEFTVNGMSVSRSGNTGLTDVMDGVTLNLASDAEGKSANLSVAATADKAVGLMSAMVNSFNTALSHLKSKLASSSSTVDGKTTYTRGVLSGDMGLSGLRLDMLGKMSNNYVNAGSLKNFSEIGLSFDKDMKLTVDSTVFGNMLKNNRTDVLALLDKGLGEINSLVSGYAGSTGSLSTTISSFDEQSKNYVNRIAKYNENLAKRKENLYNQFLGYQTQIADYGYTAQWFGMMNGTTGSNINTSG